MGGREGALYERVLDDGREIVVYPQLFNARLVISQSPDAVFYDDGW